MATIGTEALPAKRQQRHPDDGLPLGAKKAKTNGKAKATGKMEYSKWFAPVFEHFLPKLLDCKNLPPQLRAAFESRDEAEKKGVTARSKAGQANKRTRKRKQPFVKAILWFLEHVPDRKARKEVFDIFWSESANWPTVAGAI